jgi:inosose dehydratase
MQRRDFLVGSAAAAAWAAGWTLRPERRTSHIRFGYAAITWNGNDRQAIDDITAVGFHGIQLRQSAIDTWGARPDELKALLARHHLTFVALSSGNIALDAGKDADLDQHVAHARFLRAAGGQFLQVIDDRPTNPAPDDYQRLGHLLTDLGKRTADAGIPLVYHPHMGALGEGPDAIARILDAADARFVHLLLDTAHYQQGGGDPVDAVRRYAGRLRLLHLKDLQSPLPGGTPDSYRFVELGQGKVDIKGVCAALDAIAFDGWVVVELDAVTDPTRTPKESGAMARAYLERLGRKV